MQSEYYLKHKFTSTNPQDTKVRLVLQNYFWNQKSLKQISAPLLPFHPPSTVQSVLLSYPL